MNTNVAGGPCTFRTLIDQAMQATMSADPQTAERIQGAMQAFKGNSAGATKRMLEHLLPYSLRRSRSRHNTARHGDAAGVSSAFASESALAPAPAPAPAPPAVLTAASGSRSLGEQALLKIQQLQQLLPLPLAHHTCSSASASVSNDSSNNKAREARLALLELTDLVEELVAENARLRACFAAR